MSLNYNKIKSLYDSLTNINKSFFDKNFKLLSTNISKLDFKDINLEITKSNIIKFTLLFDNNKIIFISKDNSDIDEMVIYTFFINKVLIASDVVNINDFIPKFKEYLK